MIWFCWLTAVNQHTPSQFRFTSHSTARAFAYLCTYEFFGDRMFDEACINQKHTTHNNTMHYLYSLNPQHTFAHIIIRGVHLLWIGRLDHDEHNKRDAQLLIFIYFDSPKSERQSHTTWCTIYMITLSKIQIFKMLIYMHHQWYKTLNYYLIIRSLKH